jgi:hypothetical protein
MRQRLVVLTVALFALVAFAGFSLLTPGMARAQTTDDCVHDPTIVSLEVCVEHAASHGFIDNQGIENSLLAKLDAAQSAYDRGQNSVAINNLQAFINEVQAQTGKHIDQLHAQHLVMHAQLVIQAL